MFSASAFVPDGHPVPQIPCEPVQMVASGAGANPTVTAVWLDLGDPGALLQQHAFAGFLQIVELD
jgi:hypothetical protein